MALIAGTVDVPTLLGRLAAHRPLFHSEADFQHAFAWEAHAMDPSLQVRLETHPEPNVRLDLLLSRPDLGRHTAVELKYLTALWEGAVNGEYFALKNHGAHDIRAYDVVKDISRLERFVAGNMGWNGILVAITNDPSFWRPVTHGRATNADAFRIYEGVTLAGARAWGTDTGAGTMRGRESAINLVGTHALRWQDYARVDSTARGTFRALTLEVRSDTAGGLPPQGAV
jgi:hypothetical protein